MEAMEAMEAMEVVALLVVAVAVSGLTRTSLDGAHPSYGKDPHSKPRRDPLRQRWR
jgi:hypothetical protein